MIVQVNPLGSLLLDRACFPVPGTEGPSGRHTVWWRLEGSSLLELIFGSVGTSGEASLPFLFDAVSTLGFVRSQNKITS